MDNLQSREEIKEIKQKTKKVNKIRYEDTIRQTKT